MQWPNYEKNIQRLSKWFGKTLNSEQHDIFYARLHDIPDPAFKDICNELIDELKPTPMNFPSTQTILQKYRNWRTNHPEMVMGYDRTPCLDCHGKGFLWIWQRYEPLEREYCFTYRCAACENWKGHIAPHQMPAISRSLAETKGLRIEYPRARAAKEDDLLPKRPHRKERQSLNRRFREIGS